jgi:cob(I)alamin adenosyltransferase
MGKIYTKSGDRGETSLNGGERVKKNHLRLEAYGEIDELNSALGVVIAVAKQEPSAAAVVALLGPVQEELLVIGSHLATPYDPAKGLPDSLPPFNSTAVERLEHQIDELQAKLPPLRNFILPGGSLVGAHLHLARTICRRAERSLVRLAAAENILLDIETYLNRLSDFLFVVARAANAAAGEEETPWRPTHGQ